MAGTDPLSRWTLDESEVTMLRGTAVVEGEPVVIDVNLDRAECVLKVKTTCKVCGGRGWLPFGFKLGDSLDVDPDVTGTEPCLVCDRGKCVTEVVTQVAIAPEVRQALQEAYVTTLFYVGADLRRSDTRLPEGHAAAG